MKRSCVGCKYLWAKDEGYSNYTVEETKIDCLLDRNPKLPDQRPWDWDEEKDNWPATMMGRCEVYAEGPMVHLDVDGDNSWEDFGVDEAVAAAWIAHTKLIGE